MSYTEYTYNDKNSELQKLAVWDNDKTDWVVFIHGGAWRDPKMTLHDGDAWINQIKHKNVCSLSYRLSPEVQHPAHYDDVVNGFKYLLSHWRVENVVLVGHSCGTFLSLQLLESLHGAILDKVERIIAVEGIYSLPMLEKENASYADFVSDAFGKAKETWKSVTPTKCTKQLIIVHSKNDELLSLDIQPKVAETLTPNFEWVVTSGKHNEVIESASFYSLVRGYF